MRVVHADHLIAPERAPLADAAIVLDASDAIVAVGPAREFMVDARFAGLPVERVRGVVFPGLVNAHVHVELSALRERVRGDGEGFVPWVRRLIAARAEMSPEVERAGILEGARELRAAGTAFVGEITNGLGAIAALAAENIGGVAFHEVFSLDDGRARARLLALPAERKAKVEPWPARFRYAVAPHTLYTLGGALVREIVQSARDSRAVTSLHLAEHEGERRALERGEGPVIDWFTEQLQIDAAALPWPKLGPIALADELGALGPHVALVHMTDARPDELAKVAAREAPVVLCPRSNQWISGKLPPVMELRAAGVRLALGTDSLASNASLDLLAEVKLLGERFPAIPLAEIFGWATSGGARALGLSHVGTIAVGARPGLVAVLGDAIGEPLAWLLSDLSRPRRFVAEGGAS